ncbi:hypothetical protein CU102_08445 [Phyllobacterium brassicacearum]|uniref:Uncharacterized protein n=1 Tax=Phyllobacterium brassicacearum TaxID=314235 RepID=A0A2P7BSF2_9HYPH|nr:hypothetical protein [Phyllobacterium brassicacearum]PSH69403.1 hypothetical protein CU102_08445 [Phyllobacterium brassicacearum]TDQ34423.1 hypothetical protein DEV91_103155 [Phyllobacterium brassicacearum]
MEPLLVLDQGEWLGYSCLARGAWIFTSRFLLLSAAACFWTLMLSLKLWGTVKFRGDPLLPDERRALPFLTQAVVLSIFFCSVYAATTYSRETLHLSGSVLTETGCHALQSYTEKFDLVEASIEFRNFV